MFRARAGARARSRRRARLLRTGFRATLTFLAQRLPGHLERSQLWIRKAFEKTLGHVQASRRTAGASVYDGGHLRLALVSDRDLLEAPGRDGVEIAVLGRVKRDDEIAACA